MVQPVLRVHTATGQCRSLGQEAGRRPLRQDTRPSGFRAWSRPECRGGFVALALLPDQFERFAMLIADHPSFLGQSPELLRLIPAGLGREEMRFGHPSASGRAHVTDTRTLEVVGKSRHLEPLADIAVEIHRIHGSPPRAEEARAITDTSDVCSRNAARSCPRPLCNVRCSSRRTVWRSGQDTCTPDGRICWDRSSESSSRSFGVPPGAFGVALPFVSLCGRDIARSSILHKAGHRPPSSLVSTPRRYPQRALEWVLIFNLPVPPSATWLKAAMFSALPIAGSACAQSGISSNQRASR